MLCGLVWDVLLCVVVFQIALLIVYKTPTIEKLNERSKFANCAFYWLMLQAGSKGWFEKGKLQ